MAAALGHERPDWESAADRLQRVIADQPAGAFLPKDRWSMDWYYPVLAGAVTGDAARARLAAGYDRFVMDGLGVRCVADKDWVTAAETAECAMAHLAAGEVDTAARLLQWVDHLRHDDGTYFTGMVHPQRHLFPAGERSTYSAAAVILATAALAGAGPLVPLLTPLPAPAGRARASAPPGDRTG